MPIRTVLELGAGGGNNAHHLKASFDLTLVDASPSMLDLSRTINPECEHITGDMRIVRLSREFDAVFVHDAVMYMTSREDLRECMCTAFVHCKPGGVALFLPDFLRETFRECVHHGGHDGEGRALRYFEWTYDQDPSDTTYTVDFVYLLREGGGPARVEHDVHVCGLFSRSDWLALLTEAGFTANAVVDPYGREIFVARKATTLSSRS
jgi:SAM-dependent methyltransferase